MDKTEYSALLERLLEVYGCASATLGITDAEGVRYYSAGKRDIATGEAPDEHTAYMIGSCTKSFTAAAIAMLAGEGRLSLDEPVKTYIPELKMYTPELTCGLTLRDALCHRPGLPGDTFAWIPFLDEYDGDRLIAQLALCEPVAPMRTKLIYSNQMYMLLGRVIERVSGVAWEDFIRTRLLAPIGMDETYTDALNIESVQNAARPYMRLGGKLTRIPYGILGAMSPAGAMVSTASDMLKWARFHMNGGVVDGKPLIDGGALRECHTTQITLKSGSFQFWNIERKRSMGYGFGLYREDYAGHTVLQHSGNVDGFSATLSFAPYDGIGVAVLTNTEPSLVNEAMPYYVYDEAFGLPYTDHGVNIKTWADSVMGGQNEPKPDVLPLAEYKPEEVSGTYEHALYGRLTVYAQGGGIRSRLGKYDIDFEHVSGGGYYAYMPLMMGDDPIHAVFQTDVYGRVDALKMEYDTAVVYKKAK